MGRIVERQDQPSTKGHTGMAKANEELPLVEVAHRMKADPQWLRARVIRGECDGRLVAGRWLVGLDSALALKMQTESKSSR